MGVRYDDESATVVVYEQDDVMESLQILHEWYTAGIINTDNYVRDSFYYGLERDDWDYTEDGFFCWAGDPTYTESEVGTL